MTNIFDKCSIVTLYLRYPIHIEGEPYSVMRTKKRDKSKTTCTYLKNFGESMIIMNYMLVAFINFCHPFPSSFWFPVN